MTGPGAAKIGRLRNTARNKDLPDVLLSVEINVRLCDIAGVASTICQPNEFIIPDSAVVGDVLVLTKPLGTQVSSYLQSKSLPLIGL